MLTVQAVVLRYADYREADRMLTLFSPQMGKLSAAVKGVRRGTAKLRNAAEIFTYGEYVLAESKGRYTVVQFNPIDTFHDLRLDMDKLSAGVLLLNICEETIQEGSAEPQLFVLLLRCLEQLCYGESAPSDVVSVFLLKYCDSSGYVPQLKECVHCGNTEELTAFDLEEGGVCCKSCAEDTHLLPVSAGVRYLMITILDLPLDSVFKLKFSRDQSKEIYRLLSQYVTVHLEKRLKIMDYIQKYNSL